MPRRSHPSIPTRTSSAVWRRVPESSSNLVTSCTITTDQNDGGDPVHPFPFVKRKPAPKGGKLFRCSVHAEIIHAGHLQGGDLVHPTVRMVLVLHRIQMTVGHPDPELVTISLDVVHLAVDRPVAGGQGLLPDIGHGGIHTIDVPI